MLYFIGRIILCLIFSILFCSSVAGFYNTSKTKYETKMDRNINYCASFILLLLSIIIGSVIL